MRQRSGRMWMLLFLALWLPACGDDPALPAACTDGPGAMRSALRAAPGRVRVEGTALSTCMSRARDAGELQAVGAGLVGAAADLSASARRRPGGAAELRLGYLVGAAHRGAGHAGGERTELLRRLDQEGASLSGSRATYRRGVRAGRRSG